MKRMIAVALVASAASLGAATAQERTSSRTIRAAEAPRVVQQREASPIAVRRCAGAACLQSVPSLGVAF